MASNENMGLYLEALQKGDVGWGQSGRVMDYAGSGVGLVRERKYAKGAMDEARQDVSEVFVKLSRASSKL